MDYCCGFTLIYSVLVGMVINLFTTIPNNSPLAFISYSGGFEVLAHIINGFLILIISLIIILYSIKLTKSYFSKLSLLGTLFVISGIIMGLIFILGGMNNSFSIAMAMIFITTFSLYFYEFHLVNIEVKI